MNKGEKMAEQFRTPWLSDVVDLLKRDSTNRVMVGNKEFVLVVRCKDCKWYYQLWIDRGIMREHCHRVRGVVVEANGFCAWGERREDGKTD